MNLPLANKQHDHSQCIRSAIETAKTLCASNGARLTELREQVLRIVWQSHKPLGAYAVMEILGEESTRKVAPPTVYRALDFLLEQGLVHRINLLNAFIGCSHAHKKHAHNFLICDECGVAVEFETHELNRAIDDSASKYDFEVSGQSVELIGRCGQCKVQ